MNLETEHCFFSSASLKQSYGAVWRARHTQARRSRNRKPLPPPPRDMFKLCLSLRGLEECRTTPRAHSTLCIGGRAAKNNANPTRTHHATQATSQATRAARTDETVRISFDFRTAPSSFGARRRQGGVDGVADAPLSATLCNHTIERNLLVHHVRSEGRFREGPMSVRDCVPLTSRAQKTQSAQ